MKTASSQLSTHIGGETTTLATCWKVTRRDGSINTPFKHQGALKSVACDCIGLIKAIGMQHKLMDYDPNSTEALSYANYSMMPDSRRMREALSRWFIPIPVEEAQIADFYFMAWGREPQHVALITDHGIIHSYSGVGKVVEHGLDERWQQRISAAYRFPYFKGM